MQLATKDDNPLTATSLLPDLFLRPPFKTLTTSKTFKIKRKYLRFSYHIFLIASVCFYSYLNAADLTIRVGVYDNPPKVFIRESGNADGFFIDLLEEISSGEQWTLDFIPGTWEQCMERLKTGEIDLLPDVAISDERMSDFSFSDETVLTNWAQVYLPKGSGIETILDMDGKRLAVLNGDYSYSEFAKDLYIFEVQCQFIEYENFEDVFESISSGAADAGLISRLYGLQAEENYPVIKSAIICCPADLRFAVRKDRHDVLLKNIDKRLGEWKADYSSIYYVSLDKWLGIVPQGDDQTNWMLVTVLSVLGILLVLIIVILGKKYKVKSLKLVTNYRDLYQNAPVAYFSVGTDGRILRCNKTAAHLIGYKHPSRVIGLPILNFYADTVWGKEKARQNFQRFLKGEEIIDELQMQRKDDSVFWVKVFINAVYDKHNQIIESRSTVIDISDRKDAESSLVESEERFRLAFDNVPDVVAIYDHDLRIQYINTATIQITGRLPSDFIGKRDDEIWPPEVYKSYLPSLQKAFETGTIQLVESELSLQEGGNRNLRITCIPVIVENGAVREVLGITHDDTERKRAEEALRASETLFRTSFENATAGVCIVGVDGKFLKVNRVLYNLLGYSSAELSQLTFNDITLNEDKNIGSSFVKQALAGKKDTTSFEKRYVHKSGRIIWAFVSSAVIRDQTATVQYFITHIQDITEQKQAEQQLQTLNIVLQTLSMCNSIVVRATDESSLIRDICHIIVEQGGYRMAWVGFKQDDSVKSVVPAGSWGFEDDYLEKIQISWADNALGQGPTGSAIRTGQQVICTDIQEDPKFAQWRKDAVKRGYKSSTALPIQYEGKNVGALNIYSDRKAAFSVDESQLLTELANNLAIGIGSLRNARKIQEHEKHLEDLVRIRTHELETANERLMELDQLKSIFLASMSHELRTPLNSIIGFTGILLMELAGELNEEQKKQLLMVKTSSAHLLSLINDILDISKIEAGKSDLSIETFQLSEIVSEVVGSIQNAAEEKGLQLRIGSISDMTITSDNRRFKQILVNLLSNAIKYTDKGSVHLSVAPNKKTITVTVKDTGIGIKSEDLSRLFQPFQQIDATLTKKQDGTGLGLYLCQKLVTLLGGKIRAKSEYGKGSTFTFTIPTKIKKESP